MGAAHLHQVAGRLPEEHRAGLKVDGFVLHAHEDGPEYQIHVGFTDLRVQGQGFAV